MKQTKNNRLTAKTLKTLISCDPIVVPIVVPGVGDWKNTTHYTVLQPDVDGKPSSMVHLPSYFYELSEDLSVQFHKRKLIIADTHGNTSLLAKLYSESGDCEISKWIIKFA